MPKASVNARQGSTAGPMMGMRLVVGGVTRGPQSALRGVIQSSADRACFVAPVHDAFVFRLVKRSQPRKAMRALSILPTAPSNVVMLD